MTVVVVAAAVTVVVVYCDLFNRITLNWAPSKALSMSPQLVFLLSQQYH